MSVDVKELNKYILNEALSASIANNIEFVEKYLEKVPNFFNNDIERGIAYKQLLVITFSALESIWKGVANQIIVHCKNKGCTQCCEYREYKSRSEINKKSAFAVLEHLQACRLLYFSHSEYVLIRELANTRNYVHLFKMVVDKTHSPQFGKSIVEECLRMCYETIDQLTLIYDYYFQSETSCIKELDDDCYKSNLMFIKSEYSFYYAIKAYFASIKLFFNEELSKDEQHYLSEIKGKARDYFDANFYIEHFGLWLYRARSYSRTEEEFKDKKDKFYMKLRNYLPEDSKIIDRLNETIVQYLNKHRVKH